MVESNDPRHQNLPTTHPKVWLLPSIDARELGLWVSFPRAFQERSVERKRGDLLLTGLGITGLPLKD
jgi:hypothetical protein